MCTIASTKSKLDSWSPLTVDGFDQPRNIDAVASLSVA